MNIRLEKGLAYVEARVTFRGESLVLENVILDTGSAVEPTPFVAAASSRERPYVSRTRITTKVTSSSCGRPSAQASAASTKRAMISCGPRAAASARSAFVRS